MNKYFEVAKITATIAGFLVIASSIYFSEANTYDQWVRQEAILFMQNKDNDSVIAENISKDAPFWIRMRSDSYKMGTYFLAVTGLFASVSFLFMVQGYLEEGKFDKKHRVRRTR